MPEILEVTATVLNVRRSPAIVPANIIGKLGQGEVVEKIGQPSSDWLEVRNSRLNGFAAARFFSPVAVPPHPADAAPQLEFVPREAHFQTSNQSALTSTEHRHRPLAFQVRKATERETTAERCTTLNSIVQLLDVERSARYRPTGPTFCNIYAYDYCFLAGVYLPRVWWMEKALLDIKVGLDPGISYGKTVREMSANALFDWLTQWGDEYGWQQVHDVHALQEAANRGSVCVICAQRRDPSRSGHITVVVPESTDHAAERIGAIVARPLQSQAGARNKAYFTNQWWVDLDSQFRAHGFWTHPGISSEQGALVLPQRLQSTMDNTAKRVQFWLGIVEGSQLAIEVTGNDATQLATASAREIRDDGRIQSFAIQPRVVRTFERSRSYSIEVDLSFVTNATAVVKADVAGPGGQAIPPAFNSSVSGTAGQVVPMRFFITTL